MSFIIIQHYDDPFLASNEIMETIFYQTLEEAQLASGEMNDPQIVNCGIGDALLGKEDILTMLNIALYENGVHPTESAQEAQKYYDLYMNTKFKKKYE